MEEPKLALVSWDMVLADKEIGCLGASSFFNMNRTLLFKWMWRFKTQHDALWVRIIKAIHGTHLYCDHSPHHSNSSTWIACVHGIHQLKEKGVELILNVIKRVGLLVTQIHNVLVRSLEG